MNIYHVWLRIYSKNKLGSQDPSTVPQVRPAEDNKNNGDTKMAVSFRPNPGFLCQHCHNMRGNLLYDTKMAVSSQPIRDNLFHDTAQNVKWKFIQ